MRVILSIVLLLTVCIVSASFGQEDPNPNSPSPVLRSSLKGDRVLAVDSGNFKGSLPVVGKNAFEPGRRTIFTVFLDRLPLMDGEGASSFRIYLKQADGRTFELQVESIRPAGRGSIALSGRLFDPAGFRGQPGVSGDGWMYVTWRGLVSNYLKFGIRTSGGQLPAAPIAAAKPVADMPTSEFVGYRWSGDRTRFLEQASFGPTTAEDERVRRIGLRTWLAEQFEAPYPYLPMPDIPQMPTTAPSECQLSTHPACYRERYTMTPFQAWFFKEAFVGNAQLRHRMAWALSQILVTSGVTTQQSSHAIAYHKILTNGAFGSYRQLLDDITLSPTMGNYLDMVRSTKNNPNENYPREILQLFSIGLYRLNPDGTPILDGQNNPIPTFDQDVINDLSKVMTGWTYCNTASCPGASPGVVNYKAPMTLTPANHDLTAKTLLSYPGSTTTSIPACGSCTDDASIRAYADNSLRQALDNIFQHPNVGPYIGKLLIQHLVTSDPSPAYVARVTAAFNNNGTGVRGDLKTVLRAILLDPEARGDLKTAPRYGKLREPVQLVTNLARIFPARAFGGSDLSDGALSSSTSSMGQDPFNSPTVFNYFMPDHVIAGTTIVSPEFELLNSGTAVKRTNFLFHYIFHGLEPNATDSLRGTSLDLSEYVPYAEGDPTGNQLMDMLNARMMHGSLSQAQRDLIMPSIMAVPAANPLLRVKTAVYLLACSSQYQVQK